MSTSERRHARYRVLIADDSVLMRALLNAQITAHSDFDVVGEAGTGYEAIRLVHELKPDVLTLDLEMPDLGGLDALRYLMSEAPLPIVIVSAQSRPLADPALRATVDHGAVDFVPKPLSDSTADMGTFQQRLIQSLYAATMARLSNVRTQPQSARPVERSTATQAPARCVLAVAASTGGPRALAEFIPALPADLPAAVLVVQHMPAFFTAHFARRLHGMSALRVVEAEHDMPVVTGSVYIAPGGMHMDLQRDETGVKVRLTEEPPVWSLRPSADVTFRAVARTFGPASVAVIMTGMGRDGADGARVIRAVGGAVLVQDEESCVIASMPRAATPFADAAVPLDRLAEEAAGRTSTRVDARSGSLAG